MSDTTEILILGAGRWGRAVLGWVYDCVDAGADWRFKGFLDDRPDNLAGSGHDERIIGPPDAYRPRPSDRILCALGDVKLRREYCESIAAAGGQFATLIHPTAVVSRYAEIADGTMIGPGASIGAHVRIGRCTTVATHSVIAHDCTIGDYCQVSTCVLGGGVTVEDSAFLGLGVVIVPDVTIGAGAIIGAGAVVLASVAAAAKAVGNPARVIGTADRSPITPAPPPD